MSSEDHSNTFNMYIGYNRTGKSMTAQAFANEWRINNPKRTIAGFDPQGRFQHLIDPKFAIKADETGWWFGTKERKQNGLLALKHLRDALIICDDYRGMNRPNTTGKDLYALMEFRAEYNIDIIMICHSPARVLEGLATYISHYYIFYTKGRRAKFEDKIENYEECTLAATILKQYIKFHPEIIQFPKRYYDPHGDHRFPHIIVDTATGKLITQKIEQNWLVKYLPAIKKLNQ